ncbi:Arginyl-tRNA synthetase [Rhodopirellula islandica]|uniref:Arginine--tRNA ligase n=1 Tax=Rhodopirellula islandica TaxID=595434 RepID=A0A0J1BKC3_RHOIS|nr:arginine--tRNA ligase [Rhodopirellula islandica]KLU06971.1 Arginyl-tRNA synthetase [Rhodopirellula islandica]
MHLPNVLQARFVQALESLTDSPGDFAGMIRAAADPKFGDYQSNAAMPLAKKVGKSSRDVAAELVQNLNVTDLFEEPEVAGPGFINLRLKDSVLFDSIQQMLLDDRVGVSKTSAPKKVVVDFSSPNVAKPMHVGHIRSTVIGDCLARTLRFYGEEVITDNHLGDWGTQFGIIIYGYRHFGDPGKVAANPVPELSSLYRLTNQLIEYQKAKRSLVTIADKLIAAKQDAADAKLAADQAESDESLKPKDKKKLRKNADAASRRIASTEAELKSLQDKVAAVDNDPDLSKLAAEHSEVDVAVLRETAKLHEGDAENLALWKEFLPHCQDEINRIYDRLNVQFDHTLGESFYHDRLAGVVEELTKLGLTTKSDGAICVFLEGFDSPMIIQKRDGAFLYATTDLATLQYRRDEFQPDEILYVVDSRQGEHFRKFFAMAEPLGMEGVQLVHVNFGTVLGPDGRPMKTRSGSLIGLESLLNDAVNRAKEVVCNPDRLATMDPPMGGEEQQQIAEIVGIGAIKYADLSHHRTSDYKFDVDKMVALEGNTATYVQYSYARTQSILRRASDGKALPAFEQTIEQASATQTMNFTHPNERSLALMLMRFEEAVELVRLNYAPNALCDYLFETAKTYSSFNESCRVLGNDDPAVMQTRLALVVLTGRVLKKGLSLLGIDVAERM